ncbi:MAG: ribonuclease HII [Burkholderiaceae bacterium]
MIAPTASASLCIAGVDEAGRGPLAGSVFAAAVVLNERDPIEGLRDSKALTATRRERLEKEIHARALAWCVASAGVAEIDRLNILQATLLAMRRAVQGLVVTPQAAWVDGNRAPQLSIPVKTIVKGDATVPAISAASILAKGARDREAQVLHENFPGYGFAQHKGYGTAAHLQALQALGPCPVHRRSFAPVRLMIEREGELKW